MFLTDYEKMLVTNCNSKSSYHKKEILQEGEASCYYCTKHCVPAQIKEWIDGDETALCPHCGIDSLIPGKIHVKVLELCHEYWFSEKDVTDV